MDISCALASSLETPADIEVAEGLGYARAWCYDSPAIYADVWMTLTRAAERTSTIGLGPAVLVPSLRHPMVNAAAIATLAALAPGRVAVAMGTGASGRLLLGHSAVPIAETRRYVMAVRALLQGGDVEWEGRTIRMVHPAGFVAERAVDVPILVAAEGPKARAMAAEIGDGMLSSRPSSDHDAPGWQAAVAFGTVLDDGEDPGSERVLAAAGHALAGVFHGAYYALGAEAVDGLPGGREWRASVEAVPVGERHLAINEGHLVAPNAHDRAVLHQIAPLLTTLTFSGTAAELRDRAAALEAAGATEFIYQPAGPDIPNELERMCRALGR